MHWIIDLTLYQKKEKHILISALKKCTVKLFHVDCIRFIINGRFSSMVMVDICNNLTAFFDGLAVASFCITIKNLFRYTTLTLIIDSGMLAISFDGKKYMQGMWTI